MKYIRDFKEGDRIHDTYLCKHKTSAVTKNGKPYDTVVLQDKTGTVDAKVWDPNNPGIEDFDALDYIDVFGDVTNFQGQLQVNVKRIRLCREGEYNPGDYLPVSKKDPDEMYKAILGMIERTKDPYLNMLLKKFFVEDQNFIKAFRASSAAKTVHHGFVGGLMEHTLSVANMCEYFCTCYPAIKRDLLVTAALFHDIGKTKELSRFPQNDYTDEGQLLGHIVMGAQMVARKAEDIEGFPAYLMNELQHCILAHHGELEFGSPKKPALIEAMALNLADNADAKLETFSEILDGAVNYDWMGFNRLLDSNVRMTRMD